MGVQEAEPLCTALLYLITDSTLSYAVFSIVAFIRIRKVQTNNLFVQGLEELWDI